MSDTLLAVADNPAPPVTLAGNQPSVCKIVLHFSPFEKQCCEVTHACVCLLACLSLRICSLNIATNRGFEYTHGVLAKVEYEILQGHLE